MSRVSLHNLRTVVGYTLFYALADYALNRVAFSDGWTLVWPLNGVTVALLLRRPRAAWLWMLLGIELGTGIGELLDNNPFLLEIGLRLCSCLEVVICALVLPRCDVLQEWLRRPHINLRFIAALALGPGVSGLLAATLFYLTEGRPPWWSFNNWATADALGIAATMPLTLAIGSAPMRAAFTSRRAGSSIITLVLAFLSATAIFSISHYPLTFLLYPLLVLVDAVLGFVGSAIAVAGIGLIAVYCTIHGWGPFGTWPADHELPRDLALQLYFGFHLITIFPVSVMMMERRRLSIERRELAENLRRTNARLTVLASIDGLTGVANRRAFDERFGEVWESAILNKLPLALIILDLDRFKQFNDLYGHAKGDECLKAVAQALDTEMLDSDGLVARFGGEEFAILLPETSASNARLVAERVRAAVLNLGIVHGANTGNRASISVGYTSVTPTADDAKVGLIQLADAALYCAKRGGRNCVETIASIERLQAANDHFGETTKIRLRKLLTPSDR